ncbi:MAG TPA: aldehyde dehydrogenase family protein [Nitrospirota bacterium]|nr:aldehyde dehydrogenase family protein [Nitrospirota bacterium]
MNKSHIATLIENHRTFFASGTTRDISFRIEQLKTLRRMIKDNEQAFFRALRQDLGRNDFESYGGDTEITVNLIDYVLKNIRSWVKPRRVRTSLVYFSAKSFVIPEPLGTTLIIGPWNFPVQLMLSPLTGAIAAGNCAVLKPSHASAATSSLLVKLIRAYFDSRFISCVEGDRESARILLEEQFDHIFFTGGPAAGKVVMAAAAKHLTPVTLELGGKNPCIVDADTDLDITARRITWGKFYNNGQSCVAVDYLLVDKRIKHELLNRIVKNVHDWYGPDPAKSTNYGRIINETHFDRVYRLMGKGTIICGGQGDRASRYIAPTVIDGITGSEPIMEDEIFGPLLPVIEYETLDQAISSVNSRPKPLALYFFSRSRAMQERVLRETSSGGGCINDTVIHETADRLPFGGVGMSGMGKYHGKATFDTFSHERAFMRSGFILAADALLRYPPYQDHLKWLRKIY